MTHSKHTDIRITAMDNVTVFNGECEIVTRGRAGRFPGIFKVSGGSINTSCLNRVGLGAV